MLLFIFKIGLILLAIALFSALISVLKTLYRLKSLLKRSSAEEGNQSPRTVEAEFRVLKD